MLLVCGEPVQQVLGTAKEGDERWLTNLMDVAINNDSSTVVDDCFNSNTIAKTLKDTGDLVSL